VPCCCHALKTHNVSDGFLCAQSTVFEWKVLGRPVTLMLIESVVMFALVLALQRVSADSDPWRTLAELLYRHLTAALAKLRCDVLSDIIDVQLAPLQTTCQPSSEP